MCQYTSYSCELASSLSVVSGNKSSVPPIVAKFYEALVKFFVFVVLDLVFLALAVVLNLMFTMLKTCRKSPNNRLF
jgi:hypothetical protein